MKFQLLNGKPTVLHDPEVPTPRKARRVFKGKNSNLDRASVGIGDASGFPTRHSGNLDLNIDFNSGSF